MRRGILPIVLLLLAAAGTGTLVRGSSHSTFCGSCHSMKEIHASWRASPHFRVPPGRAPAECVDCHILPGAAGTLAAKLNGLDEVLIEFTNPAPTTRVDAPHFLFAENCMACHPDAIERDARPKQRVGRLAEVGLSFPHGLHLAMAEYTPGMAQRLGELDDRRAALSAGERDERERLQRVRRADCAACHGPAPRAGAGQELRTRAPADPAIPFRAENPMNCVYCHDGIGHATDPKFGFAIPPVENCARCHTGRNHGTLGLVFEAECFGGTDDAACRKCHPGISRRLLEDLPLEEK